MTTKKQKRNLTIILVLIGIVLIVNFNLLSLFTLQQFGNSHVLFDFESTFFPKSEDIRFEKNFEWNGNQVTLDAPWFGQAIEGGNKKWWTPGNSVLLTDSQRVSGVDYIQTSFCSPGAIVSNTFTKLDKLVLRSTSTGIEGGCATDMIGLIDSQTGFYKVTTTLKKSCTDSTTFKCSSQAMFDGGILASLSGTQPNDQVLTFEMVVREEKEIKIGTQVTNVEAGDGIAMLEIEFTPENLITYSRLENKRCNDIELFFREKTDNDFNLPGDCARALLGESEEEPEPTEENTTFIFLLLGGIVIIGGLIWLFIKVRK